MKLDLPDNIDELKKMCKSLSDELTVTKSELNRKKAENEFLLTAIDYLPNATFIKDSDGCIKNMNKEFERIFGINRYQYISRDSRDLYFIPEDDRIKYFDEDLTILKTNGSVHHDIPFTFHDGKEHPCFYWAQGYIVPKTGDTGIVGQIVDITKEREMEQKLRDAKDKIEEASKIDPGTGLYNRYVFDAQTKDLILNARSKKTPLSVMMADLDHFKRVNDSFGHLEGDRVLKDFAALIRSHIRSEDVPIRYGGEEFLVFFPETDLYKAKMVAERLREATHEKILLPDNSALTVSIGLVKFNPEETRTQCIARADEALYTAKETGRNQVVVFADGSETYMG